MSCIDEAVIVFMEVVTALLTASLAQLTWNGSLGGPWIHFSLRTGLKTYKTRIKGGEGTRLGEWTIAIP